MSTEAAANAIAGAARRLGRWLIDPIALSRRPEPGGAIGEGGGRASSNVRGTSGSTADGSGTGGGGGRPLTRTEELPARRTALSG